MSELRWEYIRKDNYKQYEDKCSHKVTAGNPKGVIKIQGIYPCFLINGWMELHYHQSLRNQIKFVGIRSFKMDMRK